jgi:transcription elongation factor GreA
MKKILTTKQGFDKLEKEYNHLKSVERPAIIAQIAEARDHGDLKENAEYHSAREKQSFIEGRIKILDGFFVNSQIIDSKQFSGSKKIFFSAKIELLDIDSDKQVNYQIVGEFEADLDKGLLSCETPLAIALLGKEVGDEVFVNTPKGKKNYEILKITY